MPKVLRVILRKASSLLGGGQMLLVVWYLPDKVLVSIPTIPPKHKYVSSLDFATLL